MNKKTNKYLQAIAVLTCWVISLDVNGTGFEYRVEPHPYNPNMYRIVFDSINSYDFVESRDPWVANGQPPMGSNTLYIRTISFVQNGAEAGWDGRWCRGINIPGNLPLCATSQPGNIYQIRSDVYADNDFQTPAEIWAQPFEYQYMDIVKSRYETATALCASFQGQPPYIYSLSDCRPVKNNSSCSLTTPSSLIDFKTFNASELRTGRKQSTQVNIQCTGGGGTVNVSSNEYDNTGKKIIKTDNGDPLYAIITASLNGGEKPVTPTGQPLTLLEGGNPLTIWADIRANEPQKHEGFFTNTSVITLTYQ